MATIDEALEKASLLRIIRGWSCHVQFIQEEEKETE
jgi:hypothetical protein